jgi:hypothetical protein
LSGKEGETRAIFGTSPRKTQHFLAKAAVACLEGSLREPKSLLFDGDGEPSDELRYLFQTPRILCLDRARQVREAFVVAERGNVDRSNRWRRWPSAFGLDDV